MISDGLDLCIELVAALVNGLAEGFGRDVLLVNLGDVESAEKNSLRGR